MRVQVNNEVIEMSSEEEAAYLASFGSILQITLIDFTSAITAMMDAAAQERRYDNAVSIATYAGSTNPRWAAESHAFVTWRDQIWSYCYAELYKVQAGTRPQPTIADFLAELPEIVWP